MTSTPREQTRAAWPAASASSRAQGRLRLLDHAVVNGRRVDTDTAGYLVQAVTVVVVILAALVASVVFVVWGLGKLVGLW